jgi:elongation factor G
MAHIDAGKTTTTERMLYVACATSRLGDVDKGDTVTDYMDQERERGITITSASVTFTWLAHKINLLDTPGHIDFTLEVERSLRVLDGVITLLDGTAGVEAQTLSVWNQANRYCLPKLCFINKMDRPGASVELCIESIKNKLKVEPLVTQLPVKVGRDFGTVIDLVSLDVLKWPAKSESSRDLSITPLSPQEDDQVYEQAINARGRLLEQLAEVDDEIMDRLLSDDNPLCFSVNEVGQWPFLGLLSALLIKKRIKSVVKNRYFNWLIKQFKMHTRVCYFCLFEVVTLPPLIFFLDTSSNSKSGIVTDWCTGSLRFCCEK